MLIISHVIIGATIAKAIPNPLVSIPLAFLSHFLLDMIPHAQAPTGEGYRPNNKTYIVVVIDIIASLVFLYFVGLSFEMLIVVFASVLPDLLDLTRYDRHFYRIFRIAYDFHDKIQRETYKPIGFITQLLLIVGCFLLIGNIQ